MASAAELEAILCDLHTKARENMDRLPVEEKEKLLEVFQTVVERTAAIQKDLKQSINSTDHEGKVLKMCGHFPRDNSGSIMVPTKEELTKAVNLFRQPRDTQKQSPRIVSVEAVTKEENFHYLSAGPTSPNYLFQTSEVYIVMENQEQAGYVHGLCENGCSIPVVCGHDGLRPCFHCFQFTSPTQDTRTRATYREIGTLLTSLKKVDDALKELGAVPGRGGIPQLSEMLTQYEEFDEMVARFQDEANPENRVTLYNYLCTRIRVDKRKQQATLEPLVDERLQILLKLSQFDPFEFPFVMRRAFQ
jgi:hypothetical protein